MMNSIVREWCDERKHPAPGSAAGKDFCFANQQSSATRLASLAHIENIRPIEYNTFVENMLRQYKASVFQALAHPTRIAILEVLREGELPAGAIQERLGVEQANVSQHLAILRSRQIVNSRKQGNQVFYSLRNKVLIKVLDLMRQYFQAHLHESVQMLGEIQAESRGR